MLYKSKTFELLELLDIVGFIVGLFFMGIVWTAWYRFHAGVVFGYRSPYKGD